MLRAFLKERFRLETHIGKREKSGYALLVAKSGPRLRKSDANEKLVGNINDGDCRTSLKPSRQNRGQRDRNFGDV
jgi:uncharacterized protein (TIGR03435 family)